ncbi:MAG: hypothetical protein WC891_06425 [Actinomycetota bacterium]
MADEEAKIRIYPLSRAAFPGSESKFEVEVEGAEATTIEVRPCDEAAGYEVAIDRKGGGSSFITIKAPPVADNACMDFFVEAKDATGKVVATEHAEVVIGQKSIPPTFAMTTIIGVGLIAVGLVFSSSVARDILIVLGLGVVLAAILASLFGIYGKNIGYPWHFTREK